MASVQNQRAPAEQNKKAELTIGLLEDDPSQALLLSQWLTSRGYQVFHEETGAGFLSRVGEHNPALLILDWQLPDCEGTEILQEMREQRGFSGPVLFATARSSEEDIVLGLELGADDYVTKPLRKEELLARVSALCRRSNLNAPSDRIKVGPILLEPSNCRAFVKGKPVKMTATEFKLAACVLTHVDQLLSREYLLREVWGVDAQLDTRTVDMHISRIRRLLDIGPDMGYCIRTVYRHGYRFEAL